MELTKAQGAEGFGELCGAPGFRKNRKVKRTQLAELEFRCGGRRAAICNPGRIEHLPRVSSPCDGV